MAGDAGEPHKGILPVNDVQIRTADTGVGHIDLHFITGDLRDFNLSQAELKRCSHLKRFHRITPAKA